MTDYKSPCHEGGAQLYSDGSCICVSLCCNAVTGECACPDENRDACDCNHTVTAVTAPVDGTFLVIDGVVHAVDVDMHCEPFEHHGEWLSETWEVSAKKGNRD